MQPSRAEDCALVSALKALDPAPTDLLLKSPGRSNMSAVGQPRASGPICCQGDNITVTRKRYCPHYLSARQGGLGLGRNSEELGKISGRSRKSTEEEEEEKFVNHYQNDQKSARTYPGKNSKDLPYPWEENPPVDFVHIDDETYIVTESIPLLSREQRHWVKPKLDKAYSLN